MILTRLRLLFAGLSNSKPNSIGIDAAKTALMVSSGSFKGRREMGLRTKS
jgi:hypothetical protein